MNRFFKLRKVTALALSVLLFLLPLIACTGEGGGEKETEVWDTVLTAEDGSVTFTLSLDQPSYQVGATIRAEVAVTNHSLFSKKIFANTTSLGDAGCLTVELLTNGKPSYAADNRAGKIQNGNRYESTLGRGETIASVITWDTAYAIDMTDNFEVTLAVTLQMQNGKNHQATFSIPVTDPGHDAELEAELSGGPIIDDSLLHALLYLSDDSVLKNLCVRFDTKEEAEAFKEAWLRNEAVTVLSTGRYVHTVTFDIKRGYLLSMLRQGCDETVSRG